MEELNLNEMLGRNSVEIDKENIKKLIHNKTILITGSGGTIGSELSRQIIEYNPKKMILLDIYENNLYEIERELKQKYPKTEIDAVIGSIRDIKRLEYIFKKYNPQIVFHAAAHKHVPLMEESPLEAIKNNIIGTNNLVNLSDEFKVSKFILISTDKAVNPTSIMGATKKFCEMIVQSKNKKSNTDFIIVRFGNVLESNGSVLKIFKNQIENNLPITVTDKEITRFFMTIQEAVKLILQAISNGHGGEIFVLDMGEPIKIYDLAIALIKSKGMKPNIDIPIEITGLRPGEKLYEEILTKEEGVKATQHNKIYIAPPFDIDENEIEDKLQTLKKFVMDENTTKEQIKKILKAWVGG